MAGFRVESARNSVNISKAYVYTKRFPTPSRRQIIAGSLDKYLQKITTTTTTTARVCTYNYLDCLKSLNLPATCFGFSVEGIGLASNGIRSSFSTSKITFYLYEREKYLSERFFFSLQNERNCNIITVVLQLM